jgi:hypothetical protein
MDKFKARAETFACRKRAPRQSFGRRCAIGGWRGGNFVASIRSTDMLLIS